MKRLRCICILLFLFSLAYAQQAKYVFYFIGDGMGVNQVNGTEMYLAEQEGRIGVKPLLFTAFPITGFATTFSASSQLVRNHCTSIWITSYLLRCFLKSSSLLISSSENISFESAPLL